MYICNWEYIFNVILALRCSVYVLNVDESSTVGPDLRERKGSGEAYADAGPCREDHCLRGPQPPLAQGRRAQPPTSTVMSLIQNTSP